MREKNLARVEGDAAYIALTNRMGATVAEAVISTSDLERVLSFGKWRRLGHGYVATTRFEEGKRREIYLHRFVKLSPPEMVVDHINGDPLDNRRSNLRVLHHAENMHNLKGPRSDSSTGVLNVSRSSKTGLYRVDVNGRFFGRYRDLEMASRRAVLARQQVLQYSRERTELASTA